MSLEVLQNKSQVYKARQELVKKGASVVDSLFRAILRHVGIVEGIAVGDKLKSWDVLLTLNFIEQKVAYEEPILDIGCYASEIIVALHRVGYSHLAGVDLNSELFCMPHQDVILYEVADFMCTNFESASFRAITSISVVEHGFQAGGLLQEMGRLLKPGGYFIASFDYWPQKIDTNGIRFFGQDWNIFSEEDVHNFIKAAANYSLFPVGELKYSAKDRVINCGGRRYTFAWLVLEKKNA